MWDTIAGVMVVGDVVVPGPRVYRKDLRLRD